MGDFATVTELSSGQIKKIERIGRRDIFPGSSKSRFLPQDFIASSDTTVVLFSVGNGVTTTITVRSTSLTDDKIRLAACPFQITFFEAATFSACNPGTNQIPFDVATGRYSVYGPMAMPDYTVNGLRAISTTNRYFATDSNDLVHRTSLANNSGSSQDITCLLSLRTIQSRGGQI